jgi:phospholipase/carboxylesterase
LDYSTENQKNEMNMTQKKFSLHHLVQYPSIPQSADKKHPTILALHGRGSNEEDLIGLAPYLPKELLWISPRGAHTLGINSYEWYRVKIIGRPNPEEVASALQTIDRFIGEILSEYPIDPQKLFLLGFSQGGILSMCYALSRPYRVAGVVAQSGYIPTDIDFKINAVAVKDKPFVVTHGNEDMTIPVGWARSSRDLLQRLGVYLSYYEFNMGHNISAESLAVVNAWMEKQLA